MIKYVLFYNQESPNPKNLFQIPEKHATERRVEEFRQLWKLELENEKPNLYSVLKKLFQKYFIVCVSLNAVSHLLHVASFLFVYFI